MQRILKSTVFFAMVATIAILAAGCGGGSSSTPAQPAAQIYQGRIEGPLGGTFRMELHEGRGPVTGAIIITQNSGDITGTVTGTRTGDQLNIHSDFGSHGTADFNGSVNGTSFTGSYTTSAGETGTFAVTQTDQTTPNVVGTWDGTYQLSNTDNGTSQQGTLRLGFNSQSGNTVSGVINAVPNDGNPKVQAFFNGVIIGNSFTLTNADQQQINLTLTVAGNTMTGFVTQPSGTGSFTTTRVPD